MIFHIARRSEWDAAQQSGSYRVSTRDRSLDDGAEFIHASRADQVGLVANFAYADETAPLCLLEIDPARLASPVKYEDADGTTFPHIYGPIDLDAVVAVHGYERGADGRFPDLPPSG